MQQPYPPPYIPRHSGSSPLQINRELSRTPDPTPEEQKVLDSDGKFHPTSLVKRENRGKLASVIIGITILVLTSHFEPQILTALRPATSWMHRTPGGWAIPIAVLILLSIPPLFGQEVIDVMVGITWGPYVGSAIAASGTLLGELLTFYLFRLLLSRHGSKLEDKSVEYAILARVVRDGGIGVMIIARYSAIPTHVVTALFAVCGISLPTFLIATILSLPHQIVQVLFGYFGKLKAEGESTNTSKTLQIISEVTFALVTAFAVHYIRKLQQQTKGIVIYERRKRRQAASTPSLFAPALKEGQSIHVHQPVRPSLDTDESFHLPSKPTMTTGSKQLVELGPGVC